MTNLRKHSQNDPLTRRPGPYRIILLAALLLVLTWGAGKALARPESNRQEQVSPIHPTFPLLDQDGRNVLESGGAVSTMETCGACHNTEYIAAHSDHAALGLDELAAPGEETEGDIEGVEMNCFLCHTPAPNAAARKAELETGNQAWASTATLLGSGIVNAANGQYDYAAEAFEAGELKEEVISIQDPTSANCGLCHGEVHTDLEEPFVTAGPTVDGWRGGMTGQIFSPQRLKDSGVNLEDKELLNRPWDVHAERQVSCTDCHFSLNNPVYFQEQAETRPEHLSFDPRRLELGEYLQQPNHYFARGEDDEAAHTMRGCDSCHSQEANHTWLPYKERHMEALSCETCHISKNANAAFEVIDWTAIHLDGSPRTEARGLQGQTGSLGSLISGYEPVLLPRPEVDGRVKLAPFNLVTTWFWSAGEPARPISRETVKAAWLDGGGYATEVLSTFDKDGDGQLGNDELRLDSKEKIDRIASRLTAGGLENPRIAGEVQPYSLNHGVAADEWAVRDCATCHSAVSRISQPMQLASFAPSGAIPEFIQEPGTNVNGRVYTTDTGRVFYGPEIEENGLYVLGHNRVSWIDLFGSLVFAGVLVSVGSHGTFRFLASLRQKRGHTPVKRVYMYGVYERFWHWLQTFTILGLLFTGLAIHKPDTFGIFSFRGVVLVHNILAGIVVVNAGLSLFYHLVSGEIRQYIPRPAGFIDQAIVQAIFYIKGIFKGEPHPFEKTPDQKLNPLQQMTYFGLLNVLLPLQVLTGALMWGAQRWPELTVRLGGLPFLAPFHTLVAWLFAAFVVAHVYLTTTGHTPLASIQAMMMGWDELETVPAEEAVES